MLLEKLTSTDVREDILQMFYTATVSSVSTFETMYVCMYIL